MSKSPTPNGSRCSSDDIDRQTFFSLSIRNLKKSQEKIKANENAIEQIQKKREDLHARLEKLEELAKAADEKRTEIEVKFHRI